MLAQIMILAGIDRSSSSSGGDVVRLRGILTNWSQIVTGSGNGSTHQSSSVDLRNSDHKLLQRVITVKNQYTAVVKECGKWWVGWIEEVPGVNCQEATRKELLASLKITLSEYLSPTFLIG